MSLDGAGLYQPPAPEFPAIPNTTILANDFNTIILDIAAAISQAIFRDGQAAFTANQSMGAHKLTNLAAGSNLQDAVNVLQVFFDPSFIATTADGFQITGTAMKVIVNNMILTALTLVDMSASAEVKLPANTSVGLVSAAELDVLNGITATTAEINTLAGILADVAELNLLHGVTASTAELNFLDGVTSPIQAQLDSLNTLKAPLASPALTGVPTAPTAAAGDNTTQVATTAFVAQQAFNTALPVQTGNAGKIIKTDGTNASWTALKTVNGNSLLGTGDVSIGLVLLAVVTPTAAATLDFLNVFSSTYDNYLVLAEGITFTVSGNDMLKLRFANAGVVDTASNYYGPASGGSNGLTPFSQIEIAGSTVPAGSVSAVLQIMNTNDSTSRVKTVQEQSQWQGAATTFGAVAQTSFYTKASAISGFQLYWGASNFGATGKVRVYGYQN